LLAAQLTALYLPPADTTGPGDTRWHRGFPRIGTLRGALAHRQPPCLGARVGGYSRTAAATARGSRWRRRSRRGP